MKVYFDDDGLLRHFGCEGVMTAEVEVRYKYLSITNNDDNWDFGEFEAHVDIGRAMWEGGAIVNVRCSACGDYGVSLTGKIELELVTEDELNG